MEERRKEISAKTVQRERDVKAARDNIEEVNQQWAKAWFGKDNLLDLQAGNLRDLYIARTWIEALAFSEKLMDVLLEEIRLFHLDLSKCMNIVSKAIEEFNTLLAQRIRDEIQADTRVLTQKQTLLAFFMPDQCRKSEAEKWFFD